MAIYQSLYLLNPVLQMTVEELENHVSIHGLEHLEIIAAVLKLFNVQPVAASGGFAAQDSTVGVNNAGDRLLLRQPDVTQPLMKFNAQVNNRIALKCVPIIIATLYL